MTQTYVSFTTAKRKTGPKIRLNEIITIGESVAVVLSSGRYMLIDRGDIEKLPKARICDTGRYASFYINKKSSYIHRLLLNAALDMEVDHVNGNGLDNRRCNIRICTPGQNSLNRKPMRGRKLKGLYLQKSGNYRVSITVKGKKIDMGTYHTKHDAIEAYNIAAKKYHGEFAYQNIQEEK